MSLDTDFALIAATLRRLDTRRHVSPATVEISADGPRWVAQIVADPIPKPLAASADTLRGAVGALAGQTALIDWRRVKR